MRRLRQTSRNENLAQVLHRERLKELRAHGPPVAHAHRHRQRGVAPLWSIDERHALVTQALGLKLAIKPMIPPAMAVLLFSAGVLLWRAEGVKGVSLTRLLGVVLATGGAGLLVLNGFASPQVVGYYATAFALLAMAAAAIPARQG
jgi:hypothetical protein